MSQIRTREELDKAQEETIKRYLEDKKKRENLDHEKEKIRKAESKQNLRMEQMELQTYIQKYKLSYKKRWW